ncbi:MAG: enoyl-CoA hydratase/isomerase family protein [Gammaproteobacteria bacterium]|nr:enoyl-CoA hydratase/isomerase family protein [Gammaproteobacteria bacterium]
MTEPIYIERDGAVASIILNRPDKLNALDLPEWRRIGDFMNELDADDSLRCIVIRGVDSRAFSAGADIAGFEANRNTPEQVREYGGVLATSLAAISSCRHPVIAAINGVCVGGGLEMSSACDIRVCGESSRFGAPINKLGLTMSYAELETLIGIIGSGALLEILIAGELFGAQRAYELGLVSRVLPDQSWLEDSYALAHSIAERAPLVNSWHKKFVRRLLKPEPLTATELDEGYAAFDTEDYRMGCEAFLAKREPEFKGR